MPETNLIRDVMMPKFKTLDGITKVSDALVTMRKETP